MKLKQTHWIQMPLIFHHPNLRAWMVAFESLQRATSIGIPWLTDWWYTYPSEKYEFVSWDDEIPNWMESHRIPWFQSPPTRSSHPMEAQSDFPSCWWCNNHLEKYESQWEGWHPIYEMENKNHVWNHQPAMWYIGDISMVFSNDLPFETTSHNHGRTSRSNVPRKSTGFKAWSKDPTKLLAEGLSEEAKSDATLGRLDLAKRGSCFLAKKQRQNLSDSQ